MPRAALVNQISNYSPRWVEWMCPQHHFLNCIWVSLRTCLSRWYLWLLALGLPFFILFGAWLWFLDSHLRDLECTQFHKATRTQLYLFPEYYPHFLYLWWTTCSIKFTLQADYRKLKPVVAASYFPTFWDSYRIHRIFFNSITWLFLVLSYSPTSPNPSQK